ncbi:MAG: response regulator transcription factor [Cyanobacteriota bacterium]
MSSIAKILLVDDNPKYLRDVLPMYGYEVVVANDGLQGLRVLSDKEQKFDLILLDVMMPNMDGWEVLKAIRKDSHYEYIPIIMITALDSDQKQVYGLKFGADDYIVKPFVLPNLLARIEALLRRSKWREKNQQASTVNIPFSAEEPVAPLTSREKEVLKLVAQGANNQEIAEKLVVREVTVKTHLNSIFKKLNVSNRTQAVLSAIQMNLLD